MTTCCKCHKILQWRIPASEEEKHSYEKKMKTSSSVILQWHLPPLFFLLAIDCLWSSHYTLLAPTKPHSVSLKTMWSRPPLKKIHHPLPKAINIDWSLTTYKCLFPWLPLYRKHENTSSYKTVLSYLFGSSCCQNGCQLFRRSFY